MVFIGIDNGVSGSIGIIPLDGTDRDISYIKTPVKKELNYTKTKQWLNRIDGDELFNIFELLQTTEVKVLIERPMVNPGRFKATVSALRALEATIIVLESLGFAYSYIDSKEWQKALLPTGLKGGELKEASLQIGKRLFPQIEFKGFKDADGLLIAEYSRRLYDKN